MTLHALTAIPARGIQAGNSALAPAAAKPAETDLDAKPADKEKIGKAAHDFEALLVTEMLRSSHGEGGWLSSGEDQSDDAALGMGEEQLAQALANSGGLGLAKMIEAGLSKAPSSPAPANAK